MVNPKGKEDHLTHTDLIDGATLLIDKPIGWTSFDVVNKLRWAIRNKLQKKKYKVGHAGTLDPLATGLLILCISKHTKLIETFVGQAKSYEGTFELFKTTPTYDAEMLPDTYFPRQGFGLEDIKKAAKQFEGTIEQFPPIFSALKKNGVPMYKMARKGQDVEIPSRPITIHSIEIETYNAPMASFNVDCSKGTYIRSLAYDLGKELNSGAYLKSLRRTAIGNFHVDNAWKLEDLLVQIGEIDIVE